MAKVVTDDKHYKEIADTIREFYGIPDDVYKPSEMANGVRAVADEQYGKGETAGYNFGYQMGNEEGYSEGFQEGYDDGFAIGEKSGIAEGIEQGKQAEYDRFWDAFQENGNRRNYQYGFAGQGWNDETFNPKYDIIVTGLPMRMFVNTLIVDMVGILEEQGITIDTSGATNVQYLFDSSQQLTSAPNIVCNANATALFSWCIALKTATITVNESTVFSATFHQCTALENLTVVGRIGQNGFDVQFSTKLSKASIESVVNALSTTTSGLSVTLSKTAVNTAFTTEEWATLAATKSNWTINLV